MYFVNTERINKVVIHFKSSSICVSPDFDGLTSDSPAVRPAASTDQTGGHKAVRPAGKRRSDRRRRQARQAISGRLDRSIYTGQTDGIWAVRSAGHLRSNRSPSNLRVTFIFAKSFGFWVYQPFTPLWFV